MADTQTTVALNIGSQRVSMAVFEVSKTGGLTLQAYDSESLVADPAMEAGKISQVRVALADLYERMKPGKVKARYSISGQAVFTRFVKLPPLKDEDLEQLVTFEAQQHVPFPLDEVIWDYEMIEGVDDKEVVIVAIKNDALDEINLAVNDCGLGTQEVDVSPMALYNSFRATYGTPDEPTLVIDIGAKTSNLLYIEGERFFTRSVAIGGASVTATIAKEYGVSFMEAEQQKVSNGLVALGGGHTEQLDEAVAALAMCIRNALSRLPAEIARTTNYYRSQHGGSAPRRIMLAGGGANLPYTLEFFQEKLGLPAEYFNPIGNVAVGKDVDMDLVSREGHLMGELVGLGLRAVGKSQINIDLVPIVVEQSRAAERRKPFLIGAAAILIGCAAVWAFMKNSAASKAEERERDVVEVQNRLSPVKLKIDRLLKQEKELSAIADEYVRIESNHTFWVDLMNELKSAFTNDSVWITEMKPIQKFDVNLVLNPDPAANNVANGTPVVRPDYVSAPYGKSSMIEADAPKNFPKKKGKKFQSNEPTATANAVRIRGFWRENPRSHNIVSDLIKNLRSRSELLQFEVTDPSAKGRKKDEKIDVSSDQYLSRFLTIDSVPAEPGDLGMQFDITLPLVREVPFR